MAFDPAFLLRLANGLASDQTANGQEQARRRTAVNRGYYACLVLLIQRIEVANAPGHAPPSGTHHWVRQTLHNSRRNHLLKLKQNLGTLGELRGEADYQHDRSDFTASEVQDALTRSDRLFREIQGVPQPKFAGLKW